MSHLEKLSAEQTQKIIALPYRVGLWVSDSDRSGGDASAEAEMIALESIVTAFAEDYLKSELVEEVMRLTLQHKKEWTNWGDGMENMPSECKDIIDSMKSHIPSNDVLAFQQNLVDIGISVAMAYREDDDEDEDIPSNAITEAVDLVKEKIEGFIAKLKKQPGPFDHKSLNISDDEYQVLQTMSEVLSVPLLERLSERGVLPAR